MRTLRFPSKLALFPILFLAAGAAWPSCGAHFCPRPQAGEAFPWQAGWSLQRSAFDLDGTAGAYSEAILSLRYARSDRWLAAVHLPFVILDAPGAHARGLGNPLALAEYAWHPGSARLAAGLQAEIPLGDADKGLAMDHWMLVPYGSASTRIAAVTLAGTAGISAALGGHHDEAMDMGNGQMMEMAAPMWVHPHEDLEAIYRLSVAYDARGTRARPEAFVSGQRVLSREHELGPADDYLTAGLTVPLDFGRIEIAPEAEAPISAAHRFEWTVGLSTAVRF